MTKSELIETSKNLAEGVVLLCETPKKFYILVGNTLLSHDGFMKLSYYNEDLTDNDYPELYNINKIYTFQCGLGYNNILENRNKAKILIWNRNIVELTIDEIAKKFGVSPHQIKIKK